MSNTIKTTGLAGAAALFALSTLANAAPAPEGSSGAAVSAKDKVHCYGTHACKGNSDCKTTTHECKGHNSCAAFGFKAMSAKDCLDKGGVIGDIRS